MLRVPKIVDKTGYLGIDLTNCKCFAALLFILDKISDLNGTFATLPWYSGQQMLIFTFYSYAIAKICYSVFLRLTCHFMRTSGIPKLNYHMMINYWDENKSETMRISTYFSCELNNFMQISMNSLFIRWRSK